MHGWSPVLHAGAPLIPWPALALASAEAAEHTAAQLAEALAPYAPRAPPERAQFDT